eukprot:CAMPEP_0113829846 /NCGR_PEP_ID=MMETSP0328-20130328/6016_1 /TAXON_ID=39455 /ORGANISM="Alexandrium minutum" /LENGTH=205 /DNA_ID=CAMNT_0000797925 /DNA_START=159 /DNA_END=773 /DNA_ORIENTATION=+ /assembly_acc=CAM_ASM_000350
MCTSVARAFQAPASTHAGAPSRHDHEEGEGATLLVAQKTFDTRYHRIHDFRHEGRVRLKCTAPWLEIEEGTKRTKVCLDVAKCRAVTLVAAVQRAGKALNGISQQRPHRIERHPRYCALVSSSLQGLVTREATEQPLVELLVHAARASPASSCVPLIQALHLGVVRCRDRQIGLGTIGGYVDVPFPARRARADLGTVTAAAAAGP